MIILAEGERVFALVALSYLSLLVIHAWQCLLDKLLWIFISFLLLFILSHFVIHLPANLFCIGLFLIFLFASFLSPPLFFLHLQFLFLFLDFPHLAKMVEVLLQSGQVLASLDPLGWRNRVTVVHLESIYLCDDIVSAPRPVFTGIPGEIDLLDIREFR